MSSSLKEQLRPFFEPEGMAVIGASRTEGRPGYCMVENLVKLGYRGKVYPINPEADQILGLPAYPNIESVPDKVEFAVALAPTQEIMGLVPKCASKGVKALTVTSGGFSETSREGAILETQLVEAVRRAGMRLIGPNAVGPINSSNNLAISIGRITGLKKGRIALVAQTGQVALPIIGWMGSFMRHGVSKSIDLGNKADVDDSDVLEYLADDPDTKAIALHIEGIRNGRRFVEVARRVSQRKPIICYKSGWSEAGSRAAVSHSGSIAGSDQVFNAAVKQSGMIRVRNMDSFLDFAKAFAYLRPPRGNRTGIVTITGGSGVMAADTCAEVGLRLADFSAETKKKLASLQQSDQDVSNPFDVGKAGAILYGADRAFREATQAMLDDENTDSIAILVVLSKGNKVYVPGPHTFKGLNNEGRKPIVASFTGDSRLMEEHCRMVEESGIPVVVWPERAVEILAALYQYGFYLRRAER